MPHFSSVRRGQLCFEVKLWVSSALTPSLSILLRPMRAGLGQCFLAVMTVRHCCRRGQPWHWRAAAWPGPACGDEAADVAGPEGRPCPWGSYPLGLPGAGRLLR